MVQFKYNTKGKKERGLIILNEKSMKSQNQNQNEIIRTLFLSGLSKYRKNNSIFQQSLVNVSFNSKLFILELQLLNCKGMSFGIEAIQIYFPSTFVDQKDLEKHSKVSQGKYTKGLGQLELAFAYPQEDVNSIALTVVHRILKNNNISPSQVGRLQVGTESLVDKSKSTKTHLMTLFGANHDIEGATSLNACYGATNALLNTLNWISSPSWDGRYGIVVATDVAVYEEGPARPTGGAGAIAMLISNKPKITISPVRASFIDHQYDFYKPIPSSQYPIVDGKVSMDCYINAMKQCYHLLKNKTQAENIVDKTDYLCFHTPFYKMIQKAFDALVKVDHPNATNEQISAQFLKKVEPTLQISKRIGNIYTGSLYASLVSLLYKNQQINNKKLILFSYGSGLCSTIMQAHVISNPLSPTQIFNLDKAFKNRIKINAEEYSKVMKYKQQTFGKWRGKIDVNLNIQSQNSFYLDQIDEKWRRTYKFKPLQGENLAKNDIKALQRINNINIPLPLEQKKSFHKMSIEERRETIKKGINSNLNNQLLENGGINNIQGDKIIQNVIGKVSIPLGVVPMLLINGKKYMVPMCIEEPSVIAATSSIGKFFSPHSFATSSTLSMMIGQVHIVHAQASQINLIHQRKQSIIHQLNKHCQSMLSRGGGVKQIRIRQLAESNNINYKDYSLDVMINVCDAMGANITNTIAQKAKEIISYMGIKTGISILSNYCLQRKSISKFLIPVERLAWKGHKGTQVAEKVIQAYKFAKNDIFRAVTHNKGIMNGIDAVCLATGQDWRAIEGSAHAYASRKGKYEPLSHYEITQIEGKKYLSGLLQIPIAVGTIGGTVTKNALYKQSLKILGNPSTQQLAQIIVTVGLAQNFAALRAMAIQGIQKGHMKLHVRSIMNNLKVPQYLSEQCFKYMSSKMKFDEGIIKEFLENHNKPKL